MTSEEALAITHRFSLGIVDYYHEAGSPPHERVVALVLVNPDDPFDGLCWVGPPDLAGEAFEERMPGFARGRQILNGLLDTPHGPPGTLRVFVFSCAGANACYLSTTPRAQA